MTAFVSAVSGGGVDATNNDGIWLGRPGDLSLVVRNGDHAPGTPSGVNFGDARSIYNGFNQFALNDAGQVAFYAPLTGAGVNSANNIGLWSGAPGSLALIARAGDHAPGTEDGVVFSSFLNKSNTPTVILNAAGQTAFFGALAGGGNGVGIWATDRSGSVQLIARTGDPLEIAPGDFRTRAEAVSVRAAGRLDRSAYWLTGLREQAQVPW